MRIGKGLKTFSTSGARRALGLQGPQALDPDRQCAIFHYGRVVSSASIAWRVIG